MICVVDSCISKIVLKLRVHSEVVRKVVHQNEGEETKMKPFLKVVIPALAVFGVVAVSGGVAFASVNGQGFGPGAQMANTTASGTTGTCPMTGEPGAHRGFGGPGGGMGFGSRMGGGAGTGFAGAPRGMMGDVLATLKIDSQTFVQDRQAGMSLADIAKKQGVEKQAVIDAMKKELTERIDLAVQNGRINDAQANQAKAQLDTQLKAMVEQAGVAGGMHGSMAGWWLPDTTS